MKTPALSARARRTRPGLYTGQAGAISPRTGSCSTGRRRPRAIRHPGSAAQGNRKEKFRWLAGALFLGLAFLLTAQEPVPPPSSDTSGPASTQAVAEVAAPAESAMRGIRRDTVVAFGSDAELPADQTAEVVVAILGNARVEGRVLDTVVAVGGDAEVSGNVRGDVVAVWGSVRLRPGATVQGDVVSVGREVVLEPGAQVRGQMHEVALGPLKWMGLSTWLHECVFKLRPLSFRVGWVWPALGVVYLFYVLLLLIFPRGVDACARAVDARPVTTLLVGLLTKMLVPVVGFVLLLTGLGLLILPLILVVVMAAGIFGKVGLLVFLGRRLLGLLGWKTAPLFAAFVAGGAFVTALYLVPVIGFLTLALTGLWALGAAATALWGGVRQEVRSSQGLPGSLPPASRPDSSSEAGYTAPAPPAGSVGSASGAASASPLTVSPGNPGLPPGENVVSSLSMPPPVTTAPPVPEAWAFPRAGFWERMAAGLLDLVVVSLLMALVGGPPWGWLVALAYFVGLWTWRGTTLGGVILKLKVVRLDGQPLQFQVALVRALGAIVSMLVVFLGFLWIAWDKDRQAWHDKLAGTVVVRLPQNPPLVCF